MQNFTYRARTNQGMLIAESMQALQRQTVINNLKQKGYSILSVRAENRLEALLRKQAGFTGRVKTADKAAITHQLATLLKAGMRLSRAIKTLAVQCENKYMAQALTQIQIDVEHSSTLSDAMVRHPGIFSSVYTSIVRSAEKTGTLAETFEILANDLKKQALIKSRITAAMLYPAFLLVVSTAVIIILTVFVIPRFVSLFIDAGQALPLPTRILINTTDFFKQFWPIVLIITVAMILAAVLSCRQKEAKKVIAGLVLKMPLIGIINRKILIARFARTISSLLVGGVGIVAAIRTTRSTVNNPAFAEQIGQMEEEIIKGKSVADAIRKKPFFTETIANLVLVGEETGRLGPMFSEAADIYEQQAESAINSFTTLLGPLMIVCMGGLVGFVVVAILLPVFETSAIVN